jgi:hypothetical protein
LGEAHKAKKIHLWPDQFLVEAQRIQKVADRMGGKRGAGHPSAGIPTAILTGGYADDAITKGRGSTNSSM